MLNRTNKEQRDECEAAPGGTRPPSSLILLWNEVWPLLLSHTNIEFLTEVRLETQGGSEPPGRSRIVVNGGILGFMKYKGT